MRGGFDISNKRACCSAHVCFVPEQAQVRPASNCIAIGSLWTSSPLHSAGECLIKAEPMPWDLQSRAVRFARAWRCPASGQDLPAGDVDLIILFHRLSCDGRLSLRLKNQSAFELPHIAGKDSNGSKLREANQRDETLETNPSLSRGSKVLSRQMSQQQDVNQLRIRSRRRSAKAGS